MRVKEESEKSRLKLNIQKSKIMASGPFTSWQIDGKTMETVRDFIFGGSEITADGHWRHEIKKTLAPWKKSCDKPIVCIEKQRHHFVGKGLYSQSYSFPSSHVQMWELDQKEGWAPKNECLQTVVLETPESPLDWKEIKPVNPKGTQPWIFIGRTDAETETSILWLPEENWLIGKDPDAGKDWRWVENGMIEDEMVGQHHQLDGHEFEQTPGISDG